MVRTVGWSELAVRSPNDARKARRGWRSAICAVAVSLVVGAVSEASAQGTGPGSNFVQKCLEQNRNLPSTTGYATDLNVVCNCKAKKLREKGYDPDAMEGVIRDAYSKAIEQSLSSGNGTPVVDPAMRERLQKGVNRILMDDAAAFSECIRGDIEHSVRKTMMKDMGRPS